MKNNEVFIIAEAGVNHNGDLEIAKALIDVASDSGADAVKFQSFLADDLSTDYADQAVYQAKNTGKKESQKEMLKRIELQRDDHQTLIDYCKRRLGDPVIEINVDEDQLEDDGDLSDIDDSNMGSQLHQLGTF